MNKKSILKYIAGNASEQEKEVLLNWLKQDSRNREYFARLNDLYLFASMPNAKESAPDMSIADSILAGAPKKLSGVSTPLPPESKKRSLFIRMAYYGVAAAVFIALCVNIYLLRNPQEATNTLPERHLLSEMPQGYLHTIYTTRGVKGEVKLPDGSVVKLNSDSRLMFPDKFSGETREVYMSGEAYFTVTTNPDTPMIVNTNRNFLVKVYGTEFNLRTYENENARATLFKGKVDLISKDAKGLERILAELSPNQSFEVRTKLPPLKIIKADTLKQGAWRYGNLLFEHTPMDEVIRELERWHGAEFTVTNRAIYDLKFSASFRQESLIQILEILKFCSEIDYQINENKVTLSLKK